MRRLLILLVIVLVNLPAVHERWTDQRLDSKGEDVEAAVVDARRSGGSNFLDYRLPAAVDPKRTVFSATVDDATYREARETDLLVVRMLPGHPGSNRPEGETGNPLFLIVAIAADVILVIVGLLVWQRRRRRAENGPDLYDLV